MGDVVVLGDGEACVEGTAADGSVAIAADRLEAAIGWTLKPEGLCRDDVCVPVRDRSSIEATGGGLDLVAVAGALGRRAVVDDDAGVIAISVDAESRRRTVAGGEAVEFTLPDLDGRDRSLREWAGQRKLLVCWASW